MRFPTGVVRARVVRRVTIRSSDLGLTLFPTIRRAQRVLIETKNEHLKPLNYDTFIVNKRRHNKHGFQPRSARKIIRRFPLFPEQFQKESIWFVLILHENLKACAQNVINTFDHVPLFEYTRLGSFKLFREHDPMSSFDDIQ